MRISKIPALPLISGLSVSVRYFVPRQFAGSHVRLHHPSRTRCRGVAMDSMAALDVKDLRLHMVDDERFRLGDGDTVKMEATLWTLLPSEVLELVLRWLPAASLARFRAVSKAWMALLAAPLHSSLSPLPCAFEVRRPIYKSRPGAPLGEFRCKSHELDVSWLPHQFRRWNCGMRSAFSDAGLICSAFEDSEDQLCVCLMNPHNRTWRQLPPLAWPQNWWDLEEWGLAMEGLPDIRWEVILAADVASFKVLVVAEVPGEAAFCAYSSSTGTWVTTSHPPGLGVGFDSRHKNRHIVCNDVIYALVGCNQKEMVMLSTEDGRELGRVKNLPVIHFIDFVYLAQYQGRVLWVEREFYQRYHSGSHFLACRIWMFTVQWEQIAVMPDEVLVQMKETSALNEPGHLFFYTLRDVKVAGDIVFLTLSARRQTHLVAYHMVHRSWQVILHDLSYTRGFHFLDPRPTLVL